MLRTTPPLPRQLEDSVRALDDVEAAPVVTTCHLHADRHRPRADDCVRAFSGLARRALEQADPDPVVREAVAGDLAAMERWLRHDFRRAHVRGLVLVAAGGGKVLHTLPLTVPVRDAITVGAHAATRQLEGVLTRTHRFAVALLDWERVRLFEHWLGEFTEYPAILLTGEAPDREEAGEKGWTVVGVGGAGGVVADSWMPSGSHIDRHLREIRAQRLHSASVELTRHLQAHPADHLLLGGPRPEVSRFERLLPRPLQESIAGHVHVRVSAEPDEVRAAVVEAVEAAEPRLGDQLAQRVRAMVERGAAVGTVAEVAAAADEGRVARLVLESSCDVPDGSRCMSCGRLVIGDGPCPVCRSACERVPDLVAELVDRVVTASAAVEVLPEGALSELGGIVAILRY